MDFGDRETNRMMFSKATAVASPELDIPPTQRPKHVAIIMDGNGRWAQRRGLPRIEGHRRGVASVRRVVEESARLGLSQLTLYCLSSENWKRPPHELQFLMHLLEQYMIEERALIMKQNMVVRIIGRREGISDGALREIDKTIELTRNNSGTCLCLAVNYGGRSELVDAVRAIVHAVKRGEIQEEAIDESTIATHLYTQSMPEPDLMIRTAGEMRVSNFLLWQLSYAELWVTSKCWPDFQIEDFHQALRDFAARDRRFGGLNA